MNDGDGDDGDNNTSLRERERERERKIERIAIIAKDGQKCDMCCTM